MSFNSLRRQISVAWKVSVVGRFLRAIRPPGFMGVTKNVYNLQTRIYRHIVFISKNSQTRGVKDDMR